jgi:hypothetical protein
MELPGGAPGKSTSFARRMRACLWSTKSDLISLSQTTGPTVVVTGRNTTGQAQWVAVNAIATNGFYATAWVYVEPKYTDPPAVIMGLTLTQPANGTVSRPP